MKVFTSSIYILTILLMATTAEARSKKIYEGYIITVSEDTLNGKIRMLSPALNEVKVKFINRSNKQKTYKAKDLKSYAFEVSIWNKKTRKHETEWITYVRQKVERPPVAFGPKDVLLHRVQNGKISMYNHYIEQNANAEEPLVREQLLEKEGLELVSITKINYKKVLKLMTEDYPDLQAKIGRKGHGFNHIDAVIAKYNEYMMMNSEEEFSFN